jgi:predicted Zn-dependent protease
MKRYSLMLTSLALFGCATGPTFFSEDYLASMAASQFSELKQQMTLSDDVRGTDMVNRVSSRIARAMGPEMPDAEWEFVLFEEPSANAFAMPGGKIAVFTGLLEKVDSDDELAAVIGHEIAHVLLKHANQRMSAELLRTVGGVAATVATKDMEDDDRALVMAAYGLGTQVGIMLPYSRSHETQADRLGLIIAARAGYDPRAAVTFWEKMAAAGGGSPPEFLSTHPSYDTRLDTLRGTMPEALRYYESNRNP